MTNPTDGPIHDWFELSYTNYQVLHRTLMQSMPTEWQERMVACLEELREAYQHVEQPDVFRVEAATEHIVNEMTGDELAMADIEADWYDEPVPEDLSPFDLAEWRAEHEQDRPTYYRIGDGEELDPNQRVLLPAVDPIPHYRHVYIEPRLPGVCKGTAIDPEHSGVEYYGDNIARPVPEPCSACQFTPCGPAPDRCSVENGEPCANHEREQAHADGEHELCPATRPAP